MMDIKIQFTVIFLVAVLPLALRGQESFKAEKALSNNEQGPLKYRTKRLFANELSKDTYSWKAGDTKILEVHEGKLHIEIQEENR